MCRIECGLFLTSVRFQETTGKLKPKKTQSTQTRNPKPSEADPPKKAWHPSLLRESWDVVTRVIIKVTVLIITYTPSY